MDALLSFLTTENMDVLFKYGGAVLFLLIIFYWLANNLKMSMFEQGMKQDAYTALTEQLDNLRKDFDKERDKLEEAYKQRNEAISELKKWQTLAERMEGEMQEMKEELRANNEFIREVLNSIHVFTATHPQEASLLKIPVLPHKTK
jgi:peptidoglycan hydrolase CwlO-like protein